MYVISLVFFGFAVRKYKDKYIPAAVAMMLWFFLSALLEKPTELLTPYLSAVAVAEKSVFAVMAGLLLWLCVLRKKPLRLDWAPLAGMVLAAAIRLGWYGYYQWFLQNLGEDAYGATLQLAQVQSWKNFVLQLVLSAVAVWHIWWMSKHRFIK